MECPHCGQRMLMRYGAQLSPKLADIFDVIEKARVRDGIDAETLAWLFYPDKPRKIGRRCIAVSINHINDKLASTDVKIEMSNRFGQYRVVNDNGTE